MKVFSTKLCFFVGSIGLLILRFFLLMYATDPVTGFVLPQYEMINGILTGYCFLFAGLLAWFSFTDGFRYFKKPGLPSYIAAIALAVTLCVSVAMSWPLRGLGYIGGVLKLLAAFGFAVWGIAPFIKRETSRAATLGFVPIWLYELMRVFLENNDVSAVPERIFDILTVSLILLGALQSGKHAVGVMSKTRKRFLLWIDLMAASFGLVTVLPRYVITLIGAGSQLHGSSLSDPVYPVAAVFLMLYALGSFRRSAQ